jgi:predicted nucleic acid-binding protein
MPIPVVLDRALDLADQHSLSHWDSMLVAACLEAGVDTLHTEDMGSPRVIESLQLENPFL